MSLSNFDQEADCQKPLDCDRDKKGVASDHRIIVVRPIDQIYSRPDRHQRIIQCRPLPQSGLDKYRDWLMCQDWSEIYEFSVNCKIF